MLIGRRFCQNSDIHHIVWFTKIMFGMYCSESMIQSYREKIPPPPPPPLIYCLVKIIFCQTEEI